jgi:hypothetical protein
MFKKFTILVFICLLSSPLWAEIKGKIDLGAALIDVDILESGKTVDKSHIYALKGDATIYGCLGGCFLRPSFILGGGEGRLESFSLGAGHFLPIGKNLLLMPSVGITLGYFCTKIDRKELNLFGLKEKFHSTSPYVALEFNYQLTSRWTIMGMVQYVWSRTHTVIKPLVSDKSHSEGPNYALGFDYRLNSKWSITGGIGYNISLTHEKHGLRAKGAKLGMAYSF